MAGETSKNGTQNIGWKFKQNGLKNIIYGLLISGLIFGSSVVVSAYQFEETFDSPLNNGNPLPDGYRLDIDGIPFIMSSSGISNRIGWYTVNGTGGMYHYRNGWGNHEWAYMCTETPIDPDQLFEFCVRSYNRSSAGSGYFLEVWLAGTPTDKTLYDYIHDNGYSSTSFDQWWNNVWIFNSALSTWSNGQWTTEQQLENNQVTLWEYTNQWGPINTWSNGWHTTHMNMPGYTSSIPIDVCIFNEGNGLQGAFKFPTNSQYDMVSGTVIHPLLDGNRSYYLCFGNHHGWIGSAVRSYYTVYGTIVADDIYNTQMNIIDPPLGEDVCVDETTDITANITINATDPNSPLLGNVSVCINVTCAGGYNVSEKQYVNFTGALQANITFNVTPTAIGQCNVTTCVDCDNTIPEINETDNCGNANFNVTACSQPALHSVPSLTFAGFLILTLIMLGVGVTRIRKRN